MAMTIIDEKYIRYASRFDNGGRSEVIADFYVDAADELPTADGIDGKLLHQGSMAYIITEGRLVSLGSDGKWYDTDGAEV